MPSFLSTVKQKLGECLVHEHDIFGGFSESNDNTSHIQLTAHLMLSVLCGSQLFN